MVLVRLLLFSGFLFLTSRVIESLMGPGRTFIRNSRVQVRISMSAFRQGAESRLGDWTGKDKISDLLGNVVFDCALDNTMNYLEVSDKLSLEWLQKFLNEAGPKVDEEDFESLILTKLLSSEPVRIQHTATAPTSADVSMRLTHTIEPKFIASRILNAKEDVLDGECLMISVSDTVFKTLI
jgi:hypothetical protein